MQWEDCEGIPSLKFLLRNLLKDVIESLTVITGSYRQVRVWILQKMERRSVSFWQLSVEESPHNRTEEFPTSFRILTMMWHHPPKHPQWKRQKNWSLLAALELNCVLCKFMSGLMNLWASSLAVFWCNSKIISQIPHSRHVEVTFVYLFHVC